MAQPTGSMVHYNAPLTNLTIQYVQNQDAFVATKVFPIVPVEHQSNVFYQYPRGYWNQNLMQRRAPGTESNAAGFTINPNQSYFCDVWSLRFDVPDQVRSNADAMINLDADATKFLSTQYLINQETTFVNKYMKTGVWTSEFSGVSGTPSTNQVKQWNNSATATPIEDIRVMKRQVQLAGGGYRPNKLVLGREAYDALLNTAEVVDRIKYSVKAEGQAAVVTKAVLAQLFELDEVLVMDGIINTANEAATESNAFIAGKSALLTYVPNGTPGLTSVASGLTFAWTGLLGASAVGSRIFSYYWQILGTYITEIEAAYSQNIVSADLGGFFLNVVA